MESKRNRIRIRFSISQPIILEVFDAILMNLLEGTVPYRSNRSPVPPPMTSPVYEDVEYSMAVEIRNTFSLEGARAFFDTQEVFFKCD